MDACVKAIVANFLQQVSAPVYISIPTGQEDFYLSLSQSSENHTAKERVRLGRWLSLFNPLYFLKSLKWETERNEKPHVLLNEVINRHAYTLPSQGQHTASLQATIFDSLVQ